MLKSKAWDWKISKAPWWEKPDGLIYPLVKRWQEINFSKILDLGSGLGRHSILFANNNFDVDAFDLSSEGLKSLERQVKKEKLSINITVGDMLSLPYKSKSFDCLIAFHVIYHTDDEGIEKVLREMRRVLRKGGEAFITFNSKNSTTFKMASNKKISNNTIIKTEGNEAGIPHYYANKKDVERLLRDFEIVKHSYREEYELNYIGAHHFVLVRKK